MTSQEEYKVDLKFQCKRLRLSKNCPGHGEEGSLSPGSFGMISECWFRQSEGGFGFTSGIVVG